MKRLCGSWGCEGNGAARLLDGGIYEGLSQLVKDSGQLAGGRANVLVSEGRPSEGGEQGISG